MDMRLSGRKFISGGREYDRLQRDSEAVEPWDQQQEDRRGLWVFPDYGIERFVEVM
jgi:hypothetical protein